MCKGGCITHHFLGPSRGSSKVANLQAGGIGGEDGAGLDHLTELLVELALDLEVLDDGLGWQGKEDMDVFLSVGGGYIYASIILCEVVYSI